MSRRQGGGDKIFSQKKLEKTKSSFNRKKASMVKLKKLLVACEGSKTEPYYLESFFKYLVKEHKINSKSFVIAEHKHTNPIGVLDDLLKFNVEGLTFKNFEHKWIIIDRDEERTNGGGHQLKSYNEALHKARKLGVKVAFSNPSYEIWYLLHLQYRDTGLSRDDVKKELKKIIGYEKNSKDMFDKLLPNLDTAINNATRLIDNCNKPIGLCNPSTNMHELVKCLNDSSG